MRKREFYFLLYYLHTFLCLYYSISASESLCYVIALFYLQNGTVFIILT